MATLDIRFQINFQLTNSPKDLKWTDTTNYTAAGMTASNMTILLWIVDGAGTTIYKNAGYNSNDFSAPDIDRSATAIKDTILLSVDNSGNVITGDWTFYCKIKDSSTNSVYSGNKSYTYNYSSASVVIDQSYSCRTSELTSIDSTDYDIDSITPSITRTHTITKPTKSGADAPGSNGLTERTVGGGSTPATRLWTGIWVSSISSVISYSMETWDGSDWIIIGDVITGAKSIIVTCVDSINSIITSMSAFFDRWKTAKEEDRTEAYRLGNLVTEILSLWMEYEDALRNGEDYASFAAEMATILNDEGLTTEPTSTETAVIVPWGEGSGSSTTNVITFVSSIPTGGNSGDMAIGEPASGVAWNVYYNSSGTWYLKGNLNASNAPLLENDVSDSANSATFSEQDLKIYSMPANTLDSNDQMLRIEALFHVTTSPLIDVELKLYFGAKSLGAYHNTLMPNGYYLLTTTITRTGASAQTFESKCTVYGTPNNDIHLSYDVATELLVTSIIDIKASTYKYVVGNSGDIICKYLRVQKLSK